MKKLLNLIPLALLAVGCTTVSPEKLDLVQRLSYDAAKTGTRAALAQNPKYRPELLLTYTNLNTVVEARTITGETLHQIVESLPVKQLQSEQAKIAIDGAAMLYDILAGTQVNIEGAPVVLAAGTGMRDGMKAVLFPPP